MRELRVNSAEWLSNACISNLPKEQLQNSIFQEMLHFHPDVININWGAGTPLLDASKHMGASERGRLAC